ncbi:MAG TPA: CBS domain-containing protein [Steroidobacteraceae bacterium]|nr:CBS domain-containing protein [Steroidobacteraceae bacterium]
MNVGDLCTRRVVTVSAGAPLSEVAQLMRDEHVGAVVVMRGGTLHARVAGIITDRDIVRLQLERTADLSSLSAGETMTPNPLVLDGGDPIEAAIAHLRARGVRRAPVTAADGAPIGLISVDDLLVQLATALMGAAAIVAQQPRKERA